MTTEEQERAKALAGAKVEATVTLADGRKYALGCTLDGAFDKDESRLKYLGISLQQAGMYSEPELDALLAAASP